jgi:hypothetical protein
MKRPSTLHPRNPLIAALMQRHAGSHVKSAKQQRRRAVMALKKINLLHGEKQ